MDARPDPRIAQRRAMVLAATEPARTLMTAGTVAAAVPLLRWAPRGEPHPVLVLPGLMASDLSTRVLRTWLGRLGYPVVGWALGRNRGPTQEVLSELPLLVDRLAREHGTSVSIVGWSLGGIYARRLARRAPRQVRQVISLGSPFALADRAVDGSPGARAYQRFTPAGGGPRPRRPLGRRGPARPAAARLAALPAARPVRSGHPLPAGGLRPSQVSGAAKSARARTSA